MKKKRKKGKPPKDRQKPEKIKSVWYHANGDAAVDPRHIEVELRGPLGDPKGVARGGPGGDDLFG